MRGLVLSLATTTSRRELVRILLAGQPGLSRDVAPKGRALASESRSEGCG
jgi:hypothetical protein